MTGQITGRICVQLCALGVGFGLLAACEKTQDSSSKQAAPAVATTPAMATTTETASAGSEVQSASIAQVLGTYEQLRRALADDAFDAVVGLSKRLSSEAKSAATEVSDDQKGLLVGLSQSANAVAGSEMADRDAVRKNFGEVSRHVVQLVSQSPELQKGRHLFECPMAQGYQRWVQLDPAMMNPYMGKKMLQCGTTVSWDS